MLNELCRLAYALDKAGVSAQEWHPRLFPLKKSTAKARCYCVSIGDSGEVVDVEALDNEQVNVLWKWMPTNGESFPGFNIQALYRIVEEDRKENIKQWRTRKKDIDVDVLRAWCNEDADNWDRKLVSKLRKCLQDVPRKLDEHNRKSSEVLTPALAELVQRVQHYSHCSDVAGKKHDKGFRAMLEDYIWRSLTRNESTELLLPLLVHEGDSAKSAADDRGAISLYMDIPDWNDYRVASSESVISLNQCLLKATKSDSEATGRDVYGFSDSGYKGKMPLVKLPILGNVSLRAMNSESPCQKRYGRIDAPSYPVGSESRNRARGALVWLADEKFRGKTWCRADAKELVFAYPSLLPAEPPSLAACFGTHAVDSSDGRFSAAAKSVIRQMKGISHDLGEIEIEVFALKKMDTARTQVAYHRNYSAARIAEAAKEWEDGCGNIPDVRVGHEGEGGENATATPYPLEVARSLNRVWKRDGQSYETTAVKNIAGMELFLERDAGVLASHLISVFMKNGSSLISLLGHVRHGGEKMSNAKAKGYEREKQLVPPIMGLLLHKCCIRKEIYMKDAPFLVGRMLKLSDQLHRYYCEKVRKNNIPPQLIGNSLLTSALECPSRALAELALRLKPYYGWAQTNNKEESVKLCRYFVGQYGEVANKLNQHELPSRFNDIERTQLLLGYLADIPKRSKENKSETNEEGESI